MVIMKYSQSMSFLSGRIVVGVLYRTGNRARINIARIVWSPVDDCYLAKLDDLVIVNE